MTESSGFHYIKFYEQLDIANVSNHELDFYNDVRRNKQRREEAEARNKQRREQAEADAEKRKQLIVNTASELSSSLEKS